MAVVFFGTGEFAVPSLRAIASSVDLVVCQPDRPSGRGMSLKASPIKIAATELELPVESPEKARAAEFVERIFELAPKVLIVASYGQILPERLLEAAQFGGINLHGSLLPAYRGAAPIQRALENGDAVTGITLMQMDRGMDTGGIIAPYPLPIDPLETYGELQTRLAELAAAIVQSWLPRLIRGDYPVSPQPVEGVSIAPKVERSETILNWTGDAPHEFNRWRAFTPTPGFVANTRLGHWRLGAIRPGERMGLPGQVLQTKGTLSIGLGNGSLDLIEIQPEGKKRMSGPDVANGLRLKVGDFVRIDEPASPT